MDIDLHKAANAVGYGSGRAAVMQAGAWDEYSGLPKAKYKVRIAYEIRHRDTETVTVTARCEDEAEELAAEEIEDRHGLNIEITDAEVEKEAGA